jgi:hypothetical protein
MLKWKNNIIDKSETKEEVGNVEQKQEEKQEEAPEKVEVSPVEIEIRKACGVFFATLQNISYLYGINPTKTEEMAEEWIGLVKKEDKE